MQKKLQGFAVTGSQDAAAKGRVGGAKGGKAKVKKGFAKLSKAERSRLAKLSWEKRRARAAQEEAA